MALQINSSNLDNRLCSVSQVKEALEISTGSTAEDSILNSLIQRASDAIENHVQQKFQYVDVTEELPAFGQNQLLLSRRPVRSIVSIKFDSTSTMGSTDFAVDDDKAGLVFKDSFWSTTRLRKHTIEPVPLRDGARDWEIQYKGGYDLPNSTAYDNSTRQLPADLEHACIQTVKAWYLERSNNPSLQSQKIGDASVTHFSGNRAGSGLFPPDVLNILSKYETIDPLP